MSTAPATRSTGSSKVDWLAQVRTVVSNRPTAGIIHGPPSIGKTSLAAAAPKPIFITGPNDVGIETLKANARVSSDVPNLPPCRTWSDVLSQLDWLATADHDHKTGVIDNLGDMEMLMHEEVIRREYNGERGEKGFGGYQRGYEVSLADWRQFINALDRLRDRGMSVLCIAHSKLETFKNPEGPDYDRYVPDLNKKTWSVTHKWADLVLFLNFVTVVMGQKDDMKKGKARGGQDRVMYCTNHASYEAKNRHGLPDEIEMGDSGATAWTNLITAIKEGRKPNG